MQIAASPLPKTGPINGADFTGLESISGKGVDSRGVRFGSHRCSPFSTWAFSSSVSSLGGVNGWTNEREEAVGWAGIEYRA